MLLKIYCVRDTKQGFMSPVYLDNDEAAIREFKTAVNSPKENVCNQFKEDKEFYCLGSFDSKKGIIVGEPEPRFLCSALDVFVVHGKDENTQSV